MNIDKNILEVPIEDIIPNRFQPRLAFNEEGINELSESIKEHGIIQPLVVRKLGDKYEIIAGERRYKASTMAGLTKVPVIISDIDDNKSAEVALVENIQRRNLTAIEEAKSYKNLLDRGYLTQEQLANKMGVSQSAIANKLRLLNLDDEVQEALLNEKISERHARSLLTLEDKEDQKKWLKRIIEERLTVRQLDIELKKYQENGGDDEEIPLVDINPNLDEIVSNAEDIHVERVPHDVASMLIPEGGLPIQEEIIKEQEEMVNKTPNKFFNFLEDEQANMSVLEPEDILNTFTIPNLDNELENPIHENVEQKNRLEEVSQEINNDSPTSVFDSIELLEELNLPEKRNEEETKSELESITPLKNEFQTENEALNTNFEAPIFDQQINNTEGLEENDQISEISPVFKKEEKIENPLPFSKIEDEIEPIVPPIEEKTAINAIEPTPILEENQELKPFKSIFFTNEEETPDNLENPTVNNIIEEVKPVIEETIVDPLDSIVTLEPDYEQKQEELAGLDLKTAINIVRDTVSDLEKRGFIVESEEADLENTYHIAINIEKNKE